MTSCHRPRIYRSNDGCCICGAKSSSSRFTASTRYESYFERCFALSSNEQRSGDICNACVLLVKRFRKLPTGSTRCWAHVCNIVSVICCAIDYWMHWVMWLVLTSDIVNYQHLHCSSLHCVSKTVHTFKLSVTLSHLNRFLKLLQYCKAYEICYKSHMMLPTSP